MRNETRGGNLHLGGTVRCTLVSLNGTPVKLSIKGFACFSDFVLLVFFWRFCFANVSVVLFWWFYFVIYSRVLVHAR